MSHVDRPELGDPLDRWAQKSMCVTKAGMTVACCTALAGSEPGTGMRRVQQAWTRPGGISLHCLAQPCSH